MAYIFDFNDQLHPGEGGSYDIVSDSDVSGYNVTATLQDRSSGNVVSSNMQVTGPIDAYTWRVHLPNSFTTSAAGTQLVLKVYLTDPSTPTEPEIVEALLTVLPV